MKDIKSEKLLKNTEKYKFIPLRVEKDDHIPKKMMNLVRKSKSEIFKKQIEESQATKILLATRDKFLIK